MTLVETMSPPLTPSVDCVLNRKWRSDVGPRPEICGVIGGAKSKASVQGKTNSDMLRGGLCQYQVPRTPGQGLLDDKLAHFTKACCVIIFYRLLQSTDTFYRNALNMPGQCPCTDPADEHGIKNMSKEH